MRRRDHLFRRIFTGGPHFTRGVVLTQERRGASRVLLLAPLDVHLKTLLIVDLFIAPFLIIFLLVAPVFKVTLQSFGGDSHLKLREDSALAFLVSLILDTVIHRVGLHRAHRFVTVRQGGRLRTTIQEPFKMLDAAAVAS